MSSVPKPELAPEAEIVEEDEEQSLPQPEEEAAKLRFDEDEGSLAAGRATILRYTKVAPSRPGVYRMLDGRGDVLYVGKAKNVKKRIASYGRPAGLDTRIERMIAATRTVEFVTTRTETEALLLEANLIKRLRPRFNVVLRDDKSFPYILITSDHWAPQILKHRGARTRRGHYYGPFASVWAVNRTINALQRAFLLRSCSDPFFESRARPCLLYQIKRCSAPCTKEIDFPDYSALVREANDFLSGRSKKVKDQLADEMERASGAGAFERAAGERARRAFRDSIASRRQSARRRGGRRVRRLSARWILLRRGFLLPHRPELG
jgi:excinuclease ABC subunit C